MSAKQEDRIPLEEAAHPAELARAVLQFFNCHDPNTKQIKRAQALLFSISLKVEVLYSGLTRA